MRMMVAGRANVRPTTWIDKTQPSASQTRMPEAWLGGAREEWMTERYGVRM